MAVISPSRPTKPHDLKSAAIGSVVRRNTPHTVRLSASSRLVKPLCNIVTMPLPKLELNSLTSGPQTVCTLSSIKNLVSSSPSATTNGNRYELRENESRRLRHYEINGSFSGGCSVLQTCRHNRRAPSVRSS
jgi:hypothetical protein